MSGTPANKKKDDVNIYLDLIEPFTLRVHLLQVGVLLERQTDKQTSSKRARTINNSTSDHTNYLNI